MYCYKDFREQYKDRVDDLELAIRAIHEQFCVVVEQVVEHTEDIASIKERLAVKSFKTFKVDHMSAQSCRSHQVKHCLRQQQNDLESISVSA
mmetsp:Transcript_20690/g.31590  ORF Transcript_20690/g.31590 Transcript_20690/m.31590 type:complete len:92 (+) Transcript_20690:304-579(+)